MLIQNVYIFSILTANVNLPVNIAVKIANVNVKIGLYKSNSQLNLTTAVHSVIFFFFVYIITGGGDGRGESHHLKFVFLLAIFRCTNTLNSLEN